MVGNSAETIRRAREVAIIFEYDGLIDKLMKAKKENKKADYIEALKDKNINTDKRIWNQVWDRMDPGEGEPAPCW